MKARTITTPDERKWLKDLERLDKEYEQRVDHLFRRIVRSEDISLLQLWYKILIEADYIYDHDGGEITGKDIVFLLERYSTRPMEVINEVASKFGKAVNRALFNHKLDAYQDRVSGDLFLEWLNLVGAWEAIEGVRHKLGLLELSRRNPFS